MESAASYSPTRMSYDTSWWQRSWLPTTTLRALSALGERNDMKSPPSEDRAPALAVDILIESEAWQMLPEAKDIVRRAIAVAGPSTVEIHQCNAALSRLLCD